MSEPVIKATGARWCPKCRYASDGNRYGAPWMHCSFCDVDTVEVYTRDLVRDSITPEMRAEMEAGCEGGNVKLTTTIDVALGRGQNMREHYAVRAKRVKAEREATWVALCDALPKADAGLRIDALSYGPDIGARITLHRPWARVPLDSDNLSGAFKGVRDEVASFLGVDDKSERLHWIYTQSKQPKGTLPTVTIEVMPVQDIDPQVKRIRELEAMLGRWLIVGNPPSNSMIAAETRALLTSSK